jgi:anti-sigma regulatory factor (Ser/Thr protein kinase)
MASLMAPPPKWPVRTRLELAAQPTAPGVARGHVRAVAREHGLAELAETAQLLASEIVTNAVRASQHAAARADLAAVPVIRLWITSDGVSIAIHVWDASDDMPVRHDAGPDAVSGRGLLLVETLSKDWGAYRQAGGKVVWVMVSGPGDS